MVLELLVQLHEVRLVGALGHAALLGDEFEDAARRLLQQLQAHRVVRELDVPELEALLLVLGGEGMGVRAREEFKLEKYEHNNECKLIVSFTP